jgi:hypothetical protein
MANFQNTSASPVVICNKCGFTNRHGVVYCDDCGAPIASNASDRRETRDIPPEMVARITHLGKDPQARRNTPVKPDARATFTVPRVQPDTLPGTCIFDPEYLLRLDIENAEPMAFNLIGGEEIILGRKDPNDQYVPDLDLSSFNAFDMGISRRHAALMLSGKRLTVMDLRSSNGTYINDALLDPMEAHQLRDGDMLRMGQLEMRVSFQK